MKRVTPLTPANLPVVPDSEDAGFGALKTAAGLLPLKALEIEARIVGLAAETTLRQTFVNAFPEPLEAVYIFPLPPSAAVTQFTMTAQGRRVEGTLMERTAAHAAYREALQAGHRAALAEQDRQDVFTVAVGDLPPGEAITVDLQLVSRLPCEDGEVTFRFPLVVAPRYIPGRWGIPGQPMVSFILRSTLARRVSWIGFVPDPDHLDMWYRNGHDWPRHLAARRSRHG